MDIQIFHLSAANSPRLTSQSAKTSTSRISAEPPRDDMGDQAFISYNARAVLNELRRLPEVDLSIKAQMNPAPLTEQKETQVLGRLQHGFYKRPAVLRHVAAIVTEVLYADISE